MNTIAIKNSWIIPSGFKIYDLIPLFYLLCSRSMIKMHKIFYRFIKLLTVGIIANH